jgi:broad specificity phosphatase PhoE
MSNSEFNLIIVRTGSTELDERGRLTGTLGLPLSQGGEDRIRSVAKELAELDLKLIVCGPGLASQQTAQAISQEGAVKVRIEENFANLDLGLWHGKSIDELKETQPKLYRQWREHPESVTPPEGEPLEEAFQRVRKALKKITKKHRGGTVAIVAAHPLVALIQAEFTDSELSEFWEQDIACGTWCQLNVAVAVK